MYRYNADDLKSIFSAILRDNVTPEAFKWLNDQIATLQNDSQFYKTFITVPRKTGKAPIHITHSHAAAVVATRNHLYLKDWTSDRLARSWLLLHVDPTDADQYIRTIQDLFRSAEVQELVALYSSLPILAYPEKWTARCSEGIRSNISDVLTAIMCNNPYPSENLDEPAWNQLVLKAFFTDKPIDEIIGLDARANETLAHTLCDYAHERWAAHRDVNPQLWRCVGPFINERSLPDIKKLLQSGNSIERDAAALALFSSNYQQAKNLLTPDYLHKINNGQLSWQTIANEIKNHVLQQ